MSARIRRSLAAAIASPGDVTAYALAAYANLVLVPTIGGPTRLEAGHCFFDCTADLITQAAAICAVVALVCFPHEGHKQAFLQSVLLRLCMLTLESAALRPEPPCVR